MQQETDSARASSGTELSGDTPGIKSLVNGVFKFLSPFGYEGCSIKDFIVPKLVENEGRGSESGVTSHCPSVTKQDRARVAAKYDGLGLDDDFEFKLFDANVTTGSAVDIFPDHDVDTPFVYTKESLDLYFGSDDGDREKIARNLFREVEEEFATHYRSLIQASE